MQNLINQINELFGTSPENFYHIFADGSSYNRYQWDYGYMLQYVCATAVLIVIIGSVFKFLRCLVK